MKNSILKISIEDFLHNIDTIFDKKNKKEIYMTYIMIFAVIFAFAYSLFWDSSFTEFKSTRSSIIQLNTKIQSDDMYLKVHPKALIAKLNTEIDKIKEDITLNKENNAYIKSKIETIPSLIYNEKKWGEYLDSISKNAQRYHVKIKNFTNKYAKKGKYFGHILDVSISSSADYINTLRFINSLEQSDLAVDIHTLSIKAQSRLNSDLNISVWGIRY